MPAESVLPMAIMFVLFVSTDICANLANILTQRVMIDVILNRIRNIMYSLKPTPSILFAMPLLAFFGWLLLLGGFAVTFALVSIVALLGAVLIAEDSVTPFQRLKSLCQLPGKKLKELNS